MNGIALSGYILGAVVLVYVSSNVRARIFLSLAKHPSLKGHARWSRRVARWVRYFEYRESLFFGCDNAPEDIQDKRKAALDKLCEDARNTSPKSLSFSASLENSISDVRFTSAYRVPFPFRATIEKELTLGSVVEATRGVQIKDLDGVWRYDLSGSYGVNVFGYDFYKNCLAEAMKLVSDLGPVLGPYHPVIGQNVVELKAISGLEEVSFHMSGTEAVMQAVRLARYHTGRTHLVRFCGAYHGWWDGVQPGVGNQRKTTDVYTLADLSEKSLRVLATRKDIACVLINPLQAFHPNGEAPSDSTLINSERGTSFDREQYTTWLKRIRQVCTDRGIVLIMDEVFTGFRLAYRGAQQYFGIQADLVTYGKTLGGGLPVGVLCGRASLMKRFKDETPANISFARGTFNSHPMVMAAMNVFLRRINTPSIQAQYAIMDSVWNNRVKQLNTRLANEGLPIRLANFHSILTVTYTLPSRYNWMLQFYLRAEQLELSWIGSGRFIMSFNYSDDDFSNISDRIINAATRMQEDGWWWQTPSLTNKAIKRMMLKDLLAARFPGLHLSHRINHAASACQRDLGAITFTERV